MRYVVLRDDDTNALTPVECLETLYRPFLKRGLPVNLATIPSVRADGVRPNGLTEGYLLAKEADTPLDSPLDGNQGLVSYLVHNPGYRIVQHGYDHSLFEFDSEEKADICRRLEIGRRLLVKAGFPAPRSFVAPYDRLSRCSLREVARRFRVLSTGWFERRRLPMAWWPRYVLMKLMRQPHWRVNGTLLLSHPGCLLSNQRPYPTMLDEIKKAVSHHPLTVLVTHWWEYFPDRRPDTAFIAVLHETAAWLAQQRDLKVIAFDDLANTPMGASMAGLF
jgi:hypothetical protein